MFGRQDISIDYGIQCGFDEDTIVQYLHVQDPKLEAIIRAYIHVRRENITFSHKKRKRWCACFP